MYVGTETDLQPIGVALTRIEQCAREAATMQIRNTANLSINVQTMKNKGGVYGEGNIVEIVSM